MPGLQWQSELVLLERAGAKIPNNSLSAALIPFLRPRQPTTQRLKMASDGKKVITLISSDGEEFKIDEHVAAEWQSFKDTIEDESGDFDIRVPNINGKILALVIEYYKKHAVVSSKLAGAAPTDEEVKDLKDWDADFVKGMDHTTLFDLILAANFLNAKRLFDVTCQTVADTTEGKTPEQIREAFNIKSDYTDEEEAAVRVENPWAFE